MDPCFFKNKVSEQPHPGVVKLVEKLTENIAHISGIRTITDNSKDDMQKNKFWELCHSAIGIKNYTYLKTILLSFLQKLKELSITCYHKPNRATKLMKFMNQAMVFFHLQFQDMKETIEPFDCTSYYNTITDLLALYLDMELHASRRRKEHLQKISGRLTSFLILLLDNSQEHILDTLLKSRFSKNFHEICNAVLKKFLNSDISSSIDVDMYIRYILAFKLWKKIMKSIDEKKKITKIAVEKLFWPQNLQRSADVFGSVLPKIPKSKKDPTLFFIQAKFKIKAAYEAFKKSSNNYQEPENEKSKHLDSAKNILKVKKKTFKPFSKKHKACKDTTSEKCNYKKLRKKKCRRIQKKKLRKNTNSLVRINKTDVPMITINDAGSGSMDEIKLANEFSLKNSINGKEDISTHTLLLVSSQPNQMREKKTNEYQSMEVDKASNDLMSSQLIPVQENNNDKSQSMLMDMAERKDYMSNEPNIVQGKKSVELERIHEANVAMTDSYFTEPNKVQREGSDESHNVYVEIAERLDSTSNEPNQVQRGEHYEPQIIHVNIGMKTDSVSHKFNEAQKDESDKLQNIHNDVAWDKSLFNETPQLLEMNKNDHQSMQMDIATKSCLRPNELNQNTQQDMIPKRESFNETVSPPENSGLINQKTAIEYSSVDSSDFKMIKPKIEKTDWIEERKKKEKIFISNLVPYLPKTDTKDLKSNCEVKLEVLSPENITIKQEPVDDIQMEVDPENQITLCNEKLMSQPIDSNDTYVSETSINQSLREKLPFQLMKNLYDPFIIESQELLEERTNLELSLAPRELLEYDFVSLNNIEKGESVEKFNNSPSNEFSNYIIDDCEELFSSIYNKTSEENDSATFDKKNSVGHYHDTCGEQNSLFVKSLDDPKDAYKNKFKNVEFYNEHQITCGQKNYEIENSEGKQIASNEQYLGMTESESRKEQIPLESSKSSNVIYINNERTDKSNTIIIFPGRIYSDVNPGSPSDTHFVTVGEYDIFNDQLDCQDDRLLSNEGISTEEINLHLNEDQFSKSTYYSNSKIVPQNEDNAHISSKTESNLKDKFQRSTMKDYSIQVTSDKLMNLQENIDIEKETSTAVEIPEALILETCGIGEAVSTEISDNSINAITFIRSPTSIDMLIPEPLNTQSINNTCTSESMLESFNEYELCDNGKEREHTPQLTESQILSLKEFLIIKEKDLRGNSNELSFDEKDIGLIEEQDLQESDTAVNLNSVEYTVDKGIENSSCLDDSIQFFCHNISNNCSNVPLEADDLATNNSDSKTEEPNIWSRQLEINCYNKSASNVSEPDNSCKRHEDVNNQKNNLVINFDALLSKSSTTGLENINWADQQLLNFNKEAHSIVNMSQIDISSDLLETSSKSSKSNYELEFDHVVSNRFKGVRLSRNNDAMIAANQNLKIMSSVKSSDIESDRVNINNNNISTSDLSQAGTLYCKLENPKTLPGQQDQNLTEKAYMDINILNKKTTNSKQTECSNQNISQQKQRTHLLKSISKTEVGIYNTEVSSVSSNETFRKIQRRAYLSQLDLSHENECQTVIVKEHPNLQDTALPTLNCSKCPSDSCNHIILGNNEVRLMDKNSSEIRNSCYGAKESNPSVENILEDMSPDGKGVIANWNTSGSKCTVNSSKENILVSSNEMSMTNKSSSETENTKCRTEDSNTSTKDILEHKSSDVKSVIENWYFSTNSKNESKTVNDEMRLIDENGPLTQTSWCMAQDSNPSANFFFEGIMPEASDGSGKRFQNITEKTSSVANAFKKVNLCCEDEDKHLPQHLDIQQTETVSCSKSSYGQVDDSESYANDTQRVDNDSARKCNKRKDTEELDSSSEPARKVDFYLTPIINGFSYSVGSDIKYVPLLQPPQVPEELTANLPLICTCASCYAHFLKQSEKNQTQDSANNPFISDGNYIYIEGELVENEVITVMKKLEWFLMHIISNRREPEDLEFKYKQDLESPNLPIKKRLTLAHMMSSRDGSKTDECFPSYSKKRMMSIAELEVTQNPSYYRPGPFHLYDAHLNPNGPIYCHATSSNLHLKSRFSNYNSTMVFHNGPYEYMPLETVQQYPPYSNQQDTLQCSVDSEVISSKCGHSNDTDKRYSLDRALDEVNKAVTYSKGMNSKYTNNYYEIRYKFNNHFQER